MKPVGSYQAPQSSAASYTPQCFSSSLSVPIASLIRAGVNVVGQHPNLGMTPLKAASINTNSGISDGKLPANQRSSCGASDNEVVMIDLDELPSPTKSAQEPFSNLQIQPQQRMDSLVQRARNAFPSVSPTLIGYLLNHARGQTQAVRCDEPRHDCEVAEVTGGGNRGRLNDASTNQQQSPGNPGNPGREHQTPKSANEQDHVFASPTSSEVQETPPTVDERPENLSPLREGNLDTSTTGAVIPSCTEQTQPSGGENGWWDIFNVWKLRHK